MALNTAILQVGANAMATAAPYLALHTANPDPSGSNPATSARQAANWVVNNGVMTASNIAFTGGAASGPCTYVGLWSAVTGGTYYGMMLLSGDAAFDSSGNYTLISLVVTGT